MYKMFGVWENLFCVKPMRESFKLPMHHQVGRRFAQPLFVGGQVLKPFLGIMKVNQGGSLGR